jgi:phosphatidylglycerophosphate synthase
VPLIPPTLTPNKISLGSLVFGLLCGIGCAYKFYTIGFYCWFVNRLLDGLDG